MHERGAVAEKLLETICHRLRVGLYIEPQIDHVKAFGQGNNIANYDPRIRVGLN